MLHARRFKQSPDLSGNSKLKDNSTTLFLTMEVTYSVGPRYIDGVNIDADVAASLPSKEQERAIEEPVTGLNGLGYEPGQKNKDGGDL